VRPIWSPATIVLDRYAASHAAVTALQAEDVLPADFTVRTRKYLHNVIEQDHRRIKHRVRTMLGLKCFAHAAITISGIELVHEIKKKQFDVLMLCSPHLRTPQIWEAVLAA
jgi:transposase-like protein